jgi:hypothetical protein
MSHAFPSALLAQTAPADGAIGGALALIFTIVLCLFAFCCYFLPWVVALTRGHQNTAAIFVLTLFLGWSFLGWVIALVWSFTEVKRRRRYEDDSDF